MEVRLTKYTHSCVLVSAAGKTALFDPGAWTVADGQIKARELPKLDYIVYTHEHADHFDIGFLKELLSLQHPTIICNQSIHRKIDETEITALVESSTEDIMPFSAPHGPLPVPGAQAPDNQGYHFMGVFSHAGDSHAFSETKPILAIASIAPWGRTGDMVDKVLKLKPQYVLPVHDWHHSDAGRTWLNSLLQDVFDEYEITLLDKPNGQGQVVEV